MEKPGRLTPLVDSLVANALTIEKERLTPVIDNLVENALDSGRISMMELDSAIQNEKEQLNTLTVQISHNSLTISENQVPLSRQTPVIELLVEKALKEGIHMANNEMKDAYDLYQREKVSLDVDQGRLTPIVNDIVTETINRLKEQLLTQESNIQPLSDESDVTVTLDTSEKEPIERQHTPKLDDTTENDYSESVITYQISTLSMSAMEDGMKSANRSAAVSRMSNNIDTVVNEQTVEMEQTDRASPSLLKKMEKTMEQSVVDSYTELQLDEPISIEPADRVGSAASQRSTSSRPYSAMSNESELSKQIATLSMYAMEDGRQSANRSAAVSRVGHNLDHAALSLGSMAVESGMRSAQRSAATSRIGSSHSQRGQRYPVRVSSVEPPALVFTEPTMDISTSPTIKISDESSEDISDTPEVVTPEQAPASPLTRPISTVVVDDTGGFLTPSILRLVEEAIQDGRISANRDETEMIDISMELSRLTPVVIQLVEDAINDGRRSDLRGMTPINENDSTEPGIEAQFEQTTSKILSTQLEDCEATNLLYDLQDLTSILALILRDRLSELSKFSSKTAQLNTKLEALYQTIPDHPTFPKQEIAGLLQQITIAQTLIQATTILEREFTSKAITMDGTPKTEVEDGDQKLSQDRLTPSVNVITDAALTDGLKSAEQSAVASRVGSAVRLDGSLTPEVLSLTDTAMAEGMEMATRSQVVSQMGIEGATTLDVTSLTEQALHEGLDLAERSAAASKMDHAITDDVDTLAAAALRDGLHSAARSAAVSRVDTRMSYSENFEADVSIELETSETLVAIVDDALIDGMQSAQRSQVASRAQGNMLDEDLVENAAESEEDGSSESEDESESSEYSDDTVVSQSGTEEESETEEEAEQEAVPLFVPPLDPVGEKTIWTADGFLRCIYATEKTGWSDLQVDDDLLELALGHLDESLSPVIEIYNCDCDYKMDIPFEIMYRSNTREVRARASRDGIKWVNFPTLPGKHERFDDVNFATVQTRKFRYITLVYSIRSDRLEVPQSGGMIKSHADSRIYFQFPQKLSRHKLVLNVKVTPVLPDVINITKQKGDNCRQLISTSPIIAPDIPIYNYPLRKPYTINCQCLFSSQVSSFSINQTLSRRSSMAAISQLPQIDTSLKVDEPVHLLVLSRDGRWHVNKDIKIRESRKQRGLVSFEVQDPIRRLMLLRSDGKMSDDMIINIAKELFSFQTQHYMQINVTHKADNPNENICAVFNENGFAQYSEMYLAGEDAYTNDIDDEKIEKFPIREGQMVWFNIQGNVHIRKEKRTDSTDWCGVRYRRHQIAIKKMRLDYLNQYGNYTTDAYRGVFNAYVSSKKPIIKKLDDEGLLCSKRGAPPVKLSNGDFVIERSIGEFHARISFDKMLTAVPVTLPKVILKELKIRRPKLKRTPSLLDVSHKPESKPKDTAERLAHHMSEYETTRFGESLGIRKGGLGLIRKLNKPERIRTMIISWRRSEPYMTDTRSYLADRLSDLGRSDLNKFVMKKAVTRNVMLPPMSSTALESA